VAKEDAVWLWMTGWDAVLMMVMTVFWIVLWATVVSVGVKLARRPSSDPMGRQDTFA
jgi:hypothetical protein